MHPAHVLFIWREADVREKIVSELSLSAGRQFEVECCGELSAGLLRLKEKKFDVILCNLSLPDGEGIAAFEILFPLAENVPIVVLSEKCDESVAIQALQRGAQDYVLTDPLNLDSLVRALRNSIQRKIRSDALLVESKLALVTLNSIGDAVLCTNVRDEVTYLNRIAESLTGFSMQEAIGKPLIQVFRILDGVTRKTAQDPLQMAMDQDRTVGLTANCILVRKDGVEFAIEDSAAPIHDQTGTLAGAVIVFRDVSEARARSREVTYRAEHDIVTSLPNRLLMYDRLKQSVSLAQRHNRSLAILFLDLDDFKSINDSLGHAIGDMLLKSIATRLLASVRSSDTVCRYGGDEFVIILAEIVRPHDAAVTAEKLLMAINKTHSLNGHKVNVSASIGVSIYPDDGHDSETLIKNADRAMYHAKENGGHGFEFLESEMTTGTLQRRLVEHGLRFAIDRGELLLHYQPIVALNTGEITGVEALLRWQHPQYGLIFPSHFLSIAEDCGLLVQIGAWVLREACSQAQKWQEAGLSCLTVYVNVSSTELNDKRFIRGVRQALSDSSLTADRLMLELTEEALMNDVSSTAAALGDLEGIGVPLAVEDFGIGCSSLSYLQQSQIRVIKIDQSFVQQISDDFTDSAIVTTIIGMGKNLGRVIVAEGIETEQQRCFLQSKDCPMGQGHFFSPPVPPAQIAEMLQAGKIFSI